MENDITEVSIKRPLLGMDLRQFTMLILVPFFLILSGALLYFFCFRIGWEFPLLGLSSNVEHWALFGDFFGGLLNPLIAFMVFVVVVASYEKQAEGVKVAKHELAETKKAILMSVKNQEAEKIIEDARFYLEGVVSRLGQIKHQPAALLGLYETSDKTDNAIVTPSCGTVSGEIDFLNQSNVISARTTNLNQFNSSYREIVVEVGRAYRALGQLSDCYSNHYSLSGEIYRAQVAPFARAVHKLGGMSEGVSHYFTSAIDNHEGDAPIKFNECRNSQV